MLIFATSRIRASKLKMSGIEYVFLYKRWVSFGSLVQPPLKIWSPFARASMIIGSLSNAPRRNLRRNAMKDVTTKRDHIRSFTRL